MITELGRPPELAERPDPPGDPVYEVAAVALNPIDVNIGAGRYFAGHPELPYVPGCEGVGRAQDGRRAYLFSDGLARAAALGADATVGLDEDDLVAAFKEACGGDGPTYIVDPLWGAPAVAAIHAAAPGWRLVQIGQSAGAEVSLASAPIRGKMGEIYGFTDFAVPRPDFEETYLRLVHHAAAGEIAFDLETYPFEQVAEAWERQASGPACKVVVTLHV